MRKFTLSTEISSFIFFLAVAPRFNHYRSDVLNGLSNLGCGIDFGVIDVLPILATKPILPGEGAPQTRNRLPTEVIYHNLESASQVTFDYAMLLILASILAGIGLVSTFNP
jgi:hypothetical protein